jgi:hypothetical protein
MKPKKKPEMIGSMMSTIKGRRGRHTPGPTFSRFEDKQAIANGHAHAIEKRGYVANDGFTFRAPGNPPEVSAPPPALPATDSPGL